MKTIHNYREYILKCNESPKDFCYAFKFKENIITVFYAFKLESLKDSYDISSFNCSIIFSNHLSNFWSLKCFNTVSAVGFLRGYVQKKYY